MSNPNIYDGTPIPISGSTPFGFYDNDARFQADGPKVANFVARKLGYGVMDVELDDLNIYACFEEAVSIYAEEVYQHKIKDNYAKRKKKKKTQNCNPQTQKKIEKKSSQEKIVFSSH